MSSQPAFADRSRVVLTCLVTEADFERTAALENYRDDSNLAARQSIWSYAEPAPSPLDHVDLRGVRRVVDIGCGNGLWLESLANQGDYDLLAGVDLSLGMLDAVRQRLGPTPVIVADAVALPLVTASVDVALAMWMLYHVTDVRTALDEFRRILRPDGTLLAVTVGTEHLSELSCVMTRALCRTIGTVSTEDWLPPFSFTVETAAAELAGVFGDVRSYVGRRALRVPAAEPLLSYLTSLRGPAELALGRELPWTEVLTAAKAEIDGCLRETGFFAATGITGAFVCR